MDTSYISPVKGATQASDQPSTGEIVEFKDQLSSYFTRPEAVLASVGAFKDEL